MSSTVTLDQLAESARTMGYAASVTCMGGNISAVSFPAFGGTVSLYLDYGQTSGEEWSVSIESPEGELIDGSNDYPVTSDADQTVRDALGWFQNGGALPDESPLPMYAHETIHVSREGASLRTADELSALFVRDAEGEGAELSPYGLDLIERVEARLEDQRSPYGTAWLDDDGLSDELSSLVSQVENDLATLGLVVDWEDGYVIREDDTDED